jgi:hypothetical protein
LSWPALALLCALGWAGPAGTAWASSDVDRAFGAQSRPAATRTVVAPEVAASARAQADEVRQRVAQREREARERHQAAEREAALRSNEAGPARDDAGDKPRDKAAARAGGRPGAGAAATADRRPDAPVVVRESWVLAGEMKSLVVRCPNGAERGYSWHPKTGRYCTPMMTCHTSQDWIHRALC